MKESTKQFLTALGWALLGAGAYVGVGVLVGISSGGLP